MCVPRAIAATSAARAMNPADAARAPAGPTNTAIGVRAAIMRDTIVRVDSSSPPGVRSTSTRVAAPDVSPNADRRMRTAECGLRNADRGLRIADREQ